MALSTLSNSSLNAVQQDPVDVAVDEIVGTLQTTTESYLIREENTKTILWYLQMTEDMLNSDATIAKDFKDKFQDVLRSIKDDKDAWKDGDLLKNNIKFYLTKLWQHQYAWQAASASVTQSDKQSLLEEFMKWLKKNIKRDEKNKMIADKVQELYGLSDEQSKVLQSLNLFGENSDEMKAVQSLLAWGSDRLKLLWNVAWQSEEQYKAMAGILGITDPATVRNLGKLATLDGGQITSLANIMSIYQQVEQDALKSNDINEVRVAWESLRNENEELKQMVMDKEWMLNPAIRAKYWRDRIRTKMTARRLARGDNGTVLRKHFDMTRKEMRNASIADIQSRFASFKAEYGPDASKQQKTMHIRLQHEKLYKDTEQAYLYWMTQKNAQRGQLDAKTHGKVISMVNNPLSNAA